MIIGGPLGWYPKHVSINEADDETETKAQAAPPAEEEDDATDYTAGADDAEAPDDDETTDYTDGADNAGDDDDGETPTTTIPDNDGGSDDQQIDVNVNVNNDGGDGEDEDDGGADYTAGTDNADVGGEDGGDETADDGTGDATDDGGDEMSDNGAEDSRESLFNDLNAIEDQLFGDLTDEQKKLKHNELKRLFNELYRSTDKTINKINLIPKTDANVQVIKLAAKILVELKEMIHFNITKSYYTRTFFENDVLYKQCLAQFNAVTNLLIEIAPDVSDKTESDAKDLDDKLDDLDDDDNVTITPSNMTV